MHDVVIILGFFALFQWEFTLAVLAGVLAVLGYSVNESVVIMDRIRENFRIQRRMPVVETVDLSITQNISRTIITHGRSEEHTSELQSRGHLVCRLLLATKNK